MQWGEAGSGPGQFNLPWGWLWTRQATFTWPIGATTASRSSPTASSWRALASPGRATANCIGPPAAVDPEGIYIADWGNERVQVLGPDGSFQLKLRGQATLSKWAADFLNVNPDEKRTREMSNLIPELPPHINTPYHISSQTEPWGPVSVKLDREGRLYVTEANRHRVQIYQKSSSANVTL